ncbi:Murein hydrolase activator EnvC [Andreprevotia sp. IGB-42]|uniref:murein hydrolase activator EnvC family protein n=1 Tax=Andreprevotia sp. IGB-42 TaxID=2497473 RepID=UPI00135C554F|nr:peptidoglycan DD-metalloendopeptidase family protein [Andreprevotia sp. IGB-42]KAF0811772.1 Murein hydrolase activator EnvC [Andreprevotia sp. IGB-42]
MAAPADGNARVQSAQTQEELKALHGQIDDLKKKLAANESNRKEAADALKDSESAISDANRVLGDLTQKRQLTEAELAKLEGDIAQTRIHIRASQQRLAELLNTRYRAGDLEAWKLLLNQQDPNQVSRTLGYYRYLVDAQQRFAAQLQGQLNELSRLAEEIRERNAQLKALARAKAQQKEALEDQQQEHASLVSQLSRQIDSQRNEIQKLAADEKRLTQLVDRLNAIIREQERQQALARAREQARQKQLAAQQARAAAKAAAKAAAQAKAAGKPVPPAPTPAPVTAKINDQLPDAAQAGQAFAALRGKLKLPVKGEITNRFGSQRAEGTSWKGLMIRAGAGQGVHAVASGRVVFADWLRGFGNMVIVDHGGGYLSLYSGCESVLKQVGDNIKAGDTIATTGNSGGMADSGLYFEIRQNGRPLDPLAWAG